MKNPEADSFILSRSHHNLECGDGAELERPPRCWPVEVHPESKYKLQLLAASNWVGRVRKRLSNDENGESEP
jgi:hypothetical protein